MLIYFVISQKKELILKTLQNSFSNLNDFSFQYVTRLTYFNYLRFTLFCLFFRCCDWKVYGCHRKGDKDHCVHKIEICPWAKRRPRS